MRKHIDMKPNKLVKYHNFYGNQHKYIDINKKTKISFWSKVKTFFKRLFLVCILGLVLFGIYEFGGFMNPAIVYTRAEVIKEVPTKAPILEKIIKCESGGTHFDKNGQVLMRSNTNRTVDLGVAQINTVWFAKATELGLDLTKEKDNRAMAEWIFINHGTGDWSSSSKCWNK